MNLRKTWAIVDKDGKIIETFRTKQAAGLKKPKIMKDLFYEKVEIVKIKNSQDLKRLFI